MNDLEKSLNDIKLDDILEEECKICIIGMTKEDSYRLDCGHIFHIECLKKWFESMKNNCRVIGSEKITCPYCRKKIKNEKGLYKEQKKEEYVKEIKKENKIKVVYEIFIDTLEEPIKRYGYLIDSSINTTCCAYTQKGERCKNKGFIRFDEVKEVKSEGFWLYCEKHKKYSKYKVLDN